MLTSVTEFGRNFTAGFRRVVETRQPLHITNYRKPHVVIVAAGEWDRIQGELAELRANQDQEARAA